MQSIFQYLACYVNEPFNACLIFGNIVIFIKVHVKLDYIDGNYNEEITVIIALGLLCCQLH